MHCMMVSKISKHLMLLFNFQLIVAATEKNIFQNISCYCLTVSEIAKSTDSSKFQNISCYCLTRLGYTL